MALFQDTQQKPRRASFRAPACPFASATASEHPWEAAFPAMVLLNEPSSRAYLESTDLLPSLEVGIEEMLKTCMAADNTQDPINFLAAFLMRHNPRHNPDFAEVIDARRTEAAERAAAAEQKEQAERQTSLDLHHEGGTMTITLNTAGP